MSNRFFQSTLTENETNHCALSQCLGQQTPWKWESWPQKLLLRVPGLQSQIAMVWPGKTPGCFLSTPVFRGKSQLLEKINPKLIYKTLSTRIVLCIFFRSLSASRIFCSASRTRSFSPLTNLRWLSHSSFDSKADESAIWSPNHINQVNYLISENPDIKY